MRNGLGWRSLVMVRLIDTLPRFMRLPARAVPGSPDGRSLAARDSGLPRLRH